MNMQTNTMTRHSWLIHTVTTIIGMTNKTMQPHNYKFINTREAAKYNIKLLKRDKYDITLALQREQGTMMEPGSEFRLKSTLEPLFCHHAQWDKMSKIISEGLSYPMEDISNTEQKDDLLRMIERGNHKSASTKENEPTLLKNYTKEVQHGWMLPVTTESLKRIKGAAIIPIGVAQQSSIDEAGDKYTKRRTTYDAYFPPPS